jgi:ABC-type antimicrobial peptide transport system permease subunit
LLSEAEVRRIIDRIDPSQRIQKLSTMNEIVASTTIDARFNALLFSIFAGVALSLAIIGLYGLLSYIVAFQSKEIALRLALGAPRMAIVNSFIREGLTLTTIGVALGIAAALLTSRSTASILYGVTSNNLANLLVVAAVFLLVALLASLLPSYRITRVDPAGVLRTE